MYLYCFQSLEKEKTGQSAFKKLHTIDIFV